ncbi:MAG: pyrroline-5-carboxylate reductase [Simkaniaceae bacterium]|nr:MAG: pyrroline-5-carboxylate reductase [Simkaniaceae bacterium]
MKVGIIGLGVMGTAMARIIKENHELALFSRSQDKLVSFAKEVGGKTCKSLEELTDFSEVIVLAVKPKHLETVAEDLDPLMNKETLLLSILGGVSLEILRENFSNGTLFRVMPNLPLLSRKGMIGVADEATISQEIKNKVDELLKGMGTTTWIDEPQMNAFTALTGSNPAVIYLIIEAMVEAGISMGIKADVAQEFVLKTIEGSIDLLRMEGNTTQSLRYQICSPGGTTIAGIEELEKRGVRYGIMQGIKHICAASEGHG